MAVEVRALSATIPAKTLVAAPVTIDLPIPVRTVTELELVIPDGVAGLVGFRMTMGGVGVIPVNLGGWIVGNNEVIRWPLDNFPTSGAWQLQGYNLDLFDHTIYTRFLLNPVTGAGPAPGVTILNPDTIAPPIPAG